MIDYGIIIILKERNDKVIHKFRDKYPVISSEAFIASSSDVIGNVEIMENASIWFTSVLRGDFDKIFIGKGTNIQDGSILHSDTNEPIRIGENVSVGHKCVIHGCTIDDNCIIGMGSIILNGVQIGRNTIVGAGSLVTQNKVIPEGVLCLGTPAKVIRELTQEEIDNIRLNAIHYIENVKEYRKEE